MTDQAKLFPRERRRIGRVRRALDAFVKDLRVSGTTADVELVIVSCRDTADRLDQAHGDDDESRFTATRCATEHRANLMWLMAITATSSGPDPLAALLEGLDDAPATAVRDAPPL